VRPRKFPTIWAERIQRLMWATGDHYVPMAKRFGVCRDVIMRIVTGKRKRFTVAFVRRLQAIEAQFAEDLRALDERKIRVEYSGRSWRRLDIRKHKAAGRGQALGDVGISRDSVQGDPQKTVYVARDARNRIAYYRADELGRSPLAASRSGNAHRGISQC
jgi:hypothetical protein